MPPATAKLPLAPDVVPVIHPPPVTNPGQPGGGGGGGAAGQPISACADETTTSATPVTTTCSALTVMAPAPSLRCSLMTTLAVGSVIVWFVSPLTATVWELMVSSAISELPLADAVPSVHRASARAMRKPAVMVFPPAVTVTFATDASERLWLPPATVAACSTSADSSPGTVAASRLSCAAPPSGGSGPALTSRIDWPRTVACTTVAWPL